MTEALKLAQGLIDAANISDMGRPADPKDHRRRAAAELIRLAALAQQQAQGEPVAWHERQERFPGVFGEWYERRSGWSMTRDMEITSGGIRYQFRPLYTHPAPVAEAKVPEGWKLVPIEPTPEMVEAACQDGHSVGGRPLWKNTLDIQARHRYAAMLAEAPQPGDGK